jgi:hypothetical protein
VYGNTNTVDAKCITQGAQHIPTPTYKQRSVKLGERLEVILLGLTFIYNNAHNAFRLMYTFTKLEAGCMKKSIWLFIIVFLACGFQPTVWSAPFTPGNLVLADCLKDRLIEVKIGDTECEVVQVVTWPLDDMQRRRPLGLAFDTAGNCYVGCTGVPKSATELVDFPTGLAEILRISPDGTQEFFRMPPTITKITWAKSYAPNEIYVMSNAFSSHPTYTFRVKFQGSEMLEPTLFEVSKDQDGDGKTVILPDGRILIANDAEQCINIYNQDGGEPVGKIPTQANYHSIDYQEGAQYLVCLKNDQLRVDLVDFEGAIHDSWTFTEDGIQQVFNVLFMPGDPTHFICCDKNPTDGTRNKVYIYNANDFFELPKVLSIVGLENFGALDESYFDYAFVSEPVSVPEWPLY